MNVGYGEQTFDSFLESSNLVAACNLQLGYPEGLVLKLYSNV